MKNKNITPRQLARMLVQNNSADVSDVLAKHKVYKKKPTEQDILDALRLFKEPFLYELFEIAWGSVERLNAFNHFSAYSNADGDESGQNPWWKFWSGWGRESTPAAMQPRQADGTMPGMNSPVAQEAAEQRAKGEGWNNFKNVFGDILGMTVGATGAYAQAKANVDGTSTKNNFLLGLNAQNNDAALGKFMLIGGGVLVVFLIVILVFMKK